MSFPRSALAGLHPYAPDATPVDVDLSDNTNLWGPHPAALATLAGAAAGVARYPTAYGDPVRHAVARRFAVDVACVTTGCGSDDLIDAAFRAFAEPGEALAYLAPTFSMVEHAAVTNSLELRPHVLDPANGGGLPAPRALLAGRPALVYVCSPNNPTATALPEAWLEALIDAVEAEPDGPVLLVDEAYAEFCGRSVLPAVAERSRTLVLRTLSKAYGLAGLRVGYAVGAERLVVELNKARGPFKVGVASEQAAAAALLDESGWLQDVVTQTRALRARLVTALAAQGWESLPSDANFVLIRVPGGARETVHTRLTAGRVGVRSFAFADGTHWIRATVGPWPLMERLLEALGDLR